MNLLPPLVSDGHVTAAVNGCLGLITLNRPQALNALTLPMIRDLNTLLAHWENHAAIQAVVLLGRNREGKPPAFCAGGDIRFFHQAALAKDAALWDFFTEEYALVHRIHHYPKPYIALMDGIVMGGGMGISQGAKLRVVNEHSKLAMPECHIGLFPDVGGGWFLGQCPGHTGEWLALTGRALGAGDAIYLGVADVFVPCSGWDSLLHALLHEHQLSAEHVVATVMERAELAPQPFWLSARQSIDRCFGQNDVGSIMAALKELPEAWAAEDLASIRQNSPLSLVLSLELVRRARNMSLAEDLRMERDLVHHCFEPAWHGLPCDAVEGIRALAVDKDHLPKWQHGDPQDATAGALAHFRSPWARESHPLRDLP